MKKRILCIALVLCMALTLLPLSAFAAAAPGYKAQPIPGNEVKINGKQAFNETESNNTFDTANVVGNNYTICGTCTYSDHDIFKFTLSAEATIVVYSGSAQPVWYGVMKSDGNPLGGSSTQLEPASGNCYGGFDLSLKAGTYYLMVFSDSETNLSEVTYYVDIDWSTGSHQHSFTTYEKAPTCEEEGCTIHACSCGRYYGTDFVDPLGHDYGDGTVTTAATCTEKGAETRYCSRCDACETRELDALGHDFGDWQVTKAATETEKGTETRYCSRCEATETRDIVPIGHTHSYATAVTAPTCTNEGYTTYTCTCGDSYVADYVDALGHNYVDGKCAVCGAADPDNTPVVNPFTDVSESAVYYDAILWAVENKITTGYADNTFRPAANCTRGQVVTFLWRAAGQPEPKGTCPFTDVSSTSPYYKAIIWAAEQGITTGYSDGTFRPNATVTRAQFVTFLWRYEKEPAAKGTINFADASTIAKPYQEAVAWAVGAGVTTGYNDNTFRPNDTCTRWAVVLFMYRDLK